jgi:hypothetical protein
MNRTSMKVNGQIIYVSATGKVRLGSKGSGKDVSEVYGSMSKGEARALRKTLNAGGYPALAAKPRKVA